MAMWVRACRTIRRSVMPSIGNPMASGRPWTAPNARSIARRPAPPGVSHVPSMSNRKTAGRAIKTSVSDHAIDGDGELEVEGREATDVVGAQGDLDLVPDVPPI